MNSKWFNPVMLVLVAGLGVADALRGDWFWFWFDMTVVVICGTFELRDFFRSKPKPVEHDAIGGIADCPACQEDLKNFYKAE